MHVIVDESAKKNEMRRRIDDIENVLGMRDGLLTGFDGELFKVINRLKC